MDYFFPARDYNEAAVQRNLVNANANLLPEAMDAPCGHIVEKTTLISCMNQESTIVTLNSIVQRVFPAPHRESFEVQPLNQMQCEFLDCSNPTWSSDEVRKLLAGKVIELLRAGNPPRQSAQSEEGESYFGSCISTLNKAASFCRDWMEKNCSCCFKSTTDYIPLVQEEN